MKASLSSNRRILLVDDNPSIHADFRRVLVRDDSALQELDADAAMILGGPAPAVPAETVEFELESAFQGEEALAKVKAACDAGTPYAMAFVDMRMPPGWDGLRTIQEIWAVDPGMQVVICTAYSDRSWDEIQQALTTRDRWMVVKKPFDQIEVLQLAHALTKKWDMTRAAELRQGVLEQMVSARTALLSAALRTNTEFLSNISHEMLTPMNGVLGMLQLLEDSQIDADQSELVETAKASADHLLGLLHRVLAFNQTSGNEIEPVSSTVNPEKWISSVIEAPLRAAMAAKKIDLKVQIDSGVDEFVSLPTNIVGKVLGLLLENAVKFTASGTVSVEVSKAPCGTCALQFVVSDTGVGLTRSELELLKIPFAQVDGSMSRGGSGIGIGLPLTRRLLGVLGSSLEIDSAPGSGTRFSFVVSDPGVGGEMSEADFARRVS